MLRHHGYIKRVFTASILLFSLSSLAQDIEVKEIEDLYDKIESKEEKKKQSRKKTTNKKNRTKKKGTTYSTLADLEPLADIAIIQRRYLPTSGRFEFAALGTVGMNNAFFNNIGAGLKASYFFNSKYAIEFAYYGMSPSKKDIARNLESQSIETLGISTNSYTGASFKWTPFYGKVAFKNNNIINFDTNFTIGAGSTTTAVEQASTIQFGAGQVYALSKSMGLKLDLDVHMYSAKDEKGVSQSSADIFLGAGISFYFPEATYR